jgi:glyoxylate reductase
MSPKPEVFVVQPVMDVGREALEEIAEVDVFDSYRMISRPELLNGVRDCDYLWMLGTHRSTRRSWRRRRSSRAWPRWHCFPNVVDVVAATRRGLPVTVVPHVITKTTCDLTCALVLGLAWRLVEADRFVQSGRFHQEQSTAFLTHELAGKVVGMIGLGDIGTEIVKRLRAFERDVIYTKRFPPAGSDRASARGHLGAGPRRPAPPGRFRGPHGHVQGHDAQDDRITGVRPDEAVGVLRQHGARPHR